MKTRTKLLFPIVCLSLSTASLFGSRAADDVNLTNTTITSGVAETYEALNEITASTNVTVSSGGLLVLKAGDKITLSPGFRSNSGSSLVASVGETVLADADGDLVPDVWESYYGLITSNASDALEDDDFDGVSNLAEYHNGTDPNSYDMGMSELGNSLPQGWLDMAAGDTSSGYLVGATAGELSVGPDGGASYSIPLWVSPGTSGMQPELSLVYSSRSGPGIAGHGWSISGLSAISRVPQTLATDNQIKGVDYTDTDRFALDGQRLVVINGTYGDPNSEYRTELESFSKVVANGTAGSGPAWFEVKTKSGLTIEYGNSPDSTRDAWGHSEKLSWHVNKIADVSGNYMSFFYTEDMYNGIYRINRIEYGGNSVAGTSHYATVKFNYESRPDPAYGYVKGVKLAETMRLDSIESKYGSTRNRRYEFNYTTSGPSNRSLLTSLVERGMNSESFKPLEFAYSTSTAGWTTNSNFNPPAAIADDNASGHNGFVDLNADGYPDFVEAYKTHGSTVFSSKAWLNTGSGWQYSSAYELPQPLGFLNSGYNQGHGGRFADVNGDGQMDYLFGFDDGAVSNDKTVVYFHNGSGWHHNSSWDIPEWLHDRNRPDWVRRLMDINGDGLVDLIYNNTISPVSSIAAAYINLGPDPQNMTWDPDLGYYTHWEKVDGWIPPFADFSLSHTVFMDVNGDGLPDQIQSQEMLANCTTYPENKYGVAINTGDGWSWETYSSSEPWGSKTSGNTTGTTKHHIKYLPLKPLSNWCAGVTICATEIIDLNGDGLPDMLHYDTHSDWNTSHAFVNTGDGWVEDFGYEAAFPLGYKGSNHGVAFIDVNGDGLLDQVKNDNGSKLFAYNDGIGFTINSSSLSTDYELDADSGNGYEHSGSSFVDVDGDGMVDQLYWKKNSSGSTIARSAKINTAQPMDQLIKVTNAFGVEANIHYASLLKSGLYVDGLDASGTQAKAIGPMQVVEKVEFDDGAGGTYDMEYAYSGYKVDRERGSLGFESMTVIDSRKGTSSTSSYSQEWPTIGMIKGSLTLASGGAKLSESSVKYGSKPLNSNKNTFVFAERNEQKSYSLKSGTPQTSQLFNTVSTEYFNDTNSNDKLDTNEESYDDWGNALWVFVDSGDGYTKMTESTYDTSSSRISKWHLGRLTETKVNASNPSGITPFDANRKSHFEYDATTGLLTKEILQPNNTTNLKLVTSYEYDDFGNIIKTTVDDHIAGSGGLEPRTTQTDYDDYGRFPDWTENALGHRTTYVYLANRGVMESSTDSNEIWVSTNFDSFSRPIRTETSAGIVTTIDRKWANSYAPSGSVYFVHTETDGAPPSMSFHDELGRETYAYGINGGDIVNQQPRIVGARTTYDNVGRVFSKTRPFYHGDAINVASETLYDELDRPTQIKLADDAATGGWAYTTYSYDGFSATATDSEGYKTRTTKNSQGHTTEIVNNLDAGSSADDYGRVTYKHDGWGNLRETHVWEGSTSIVTTLHYDKLGRKTQMVDPDMGTWNYAYNAYGELTSQTDAKSQTVTMSYDKLGRMTSRTEPEGTTTWYYDTETRSGSLKWEGLLDYVVGPTDRGRKYEEHHSYDSEGRPSSTTRTIRTATNAIEKSFISYQDYDTHGRPTIYTYPSGFKVKNEYNGLGFLKEIVYAGGGGTIATTLPANYKFWQADSYSVYGGINGSRLGNGVNVDYHFDEKTGRLAGLYSGLGASSDLIEHIYAYDTLGNLKGRTKDGVAEVFGYDGLNRLTSHQSGGATIDSAAYDALGNITSKTSNGTTMSYGYGAKPHAATTVGGVGYAYDANGNMTSGDGRTLEWSGSNHVEKMTKGNLSAEFWFGTSRERVVKLEQTTVNNAITKQALTYYVGSSYEEIERFGGVPLVTYEKKHYVNTPIGRLVMLTDISTESDAKVRYFHQDNQGSVYAVTNEFGSVERRYDYDAWGKQSETYTASWAQEGQNRGYTDHEMLNDFGLIHMNGRVYDPDLARFASADPFVQDAKNSQSYNRYSYVWNNPMTNVDPSGYFSLGDILKIAVVIAVVAFVGPQVAKWATKAFEGTFWATKAGAGIIGGGAAGFASGFSSSLLNGGSLGDAFKAGIKGGIQGAITGGLLGRIGGMEALNWFQRGLAHGTVHGTMAEVTGGDFRHGFASGFVSGSTDGLIAEHVSDEALQVAYAAVLGGTVSVLGGGKFANGAISGAFSMMFNEQSKPTGKGPVKNGQPVGLPKGEWKWVEVKGNKRGGYWVNEKQGAKVIKANWHKPDRVTSQGHWDAVKKVGNNHQEKIRLSRTGKTLNVNQAHFGTNNQDRMRGNGTQWRRPNVKPGVRVNGNFWLMVGPEIERSFKIWYQRGKDSIYEIRRHHKAYDVEDLPGGTTTL